MERLAGSKTWLLAFGPGVLFAAAAVGVSHLVQATRAGAAYGLGLFLVVVLANVLKYPAFRFGPHYAAATGTSLLEGYRQQGRWALWLYAVLTFGTMFTVMGAVTLVAAGLVVSTLDLHLPASTVVGALIVVSSALVLVGRYRWLDRITKWLVALFTVCTLVATALAAEKLQWGEQRLWIESIDKRALFFIAALVGWMPSAIDVSVWQSLWTLARRENSGHTPTLKQATLDFHIGYLTTSFLALCFVLLGAGVMHGSGVTFKAGAGPFASQVVSLYAATLGPWSRPLIGAAACFVMFSTVLTVADGFPRALTVLRGRLTTSERPDYFEMETRTARRTYKGALLILALGSFAVVSLLLSSLKALVDVATTLSFLSAPILSWLNHRAVTSPAIPKDKRPRAWLTGYSALAIVLQGALAVGYLLLRYS